MTNDKISNRPPKGTADWWPPELRLRHYIFETWRRVNQQFGYDEYLTPLLETAVIYRAKSGEDVGGKELMTMSDRAGRELAIRPEMTPSVTRMVTRFYKESAKPLRLFSIANYWRNERPQRGRNREFWQLNSDIFGSDSLNADIEILQLALELMLAFNPPEGSFVLYLNHRRLIDAILSDIAQVPANLITDTVRVMDKFLKLPLEKFTLALGELGLGKTAVSHLTTFLQCKNSTQLLESFPNLADNAAYQEITTIITLLEQAGYEKWIQFNPSVIRGFDYYDGMVFEVYDHHPKNNRALFGGGRYNGLAHLFGNDDIPAVGFAPGDETIKLFLESWEIIPTSLQDKKQVYFPLLHDDLISNVNQIARQLRNAGIQVEQGLMVQKMGKALKFANKKGMPAMLILGSNEVETNTISIKDLNTGEQKTILTDSLVAELQDLLVK